MVRAATRLSITPEPARERAAVVIANQHDLLLGLRGRGAELTASDGS